jgi:hypothetical protein
MFVLAASREDLPHPGPERLGDPPEPAAGH